MGALVLDTIASGRRLGLPRKGAAEEEPSGA
jgi:hypothetical protein